MIPSRHISRKTTEIARSGMSVPVEVVEPCSQEVIQLHQDPEVFPSDAVRCGRASGEEKM